ncbi:MAG TPA: hypothetical protein VFR81_08340 [Longimicrobium sp.]|nr:hypothetical protein [Longimicrobium sp.]
MTNNDMVDEIRRALSERIDEVGLRATAREVGLSPTATKAIAEDRAEPHRKTLDRLRAWHGGQESNPPPPTAEELRKTLLSITRHLPAEKRHPLIARIEAMLREAASD